MTTHQFHKDQDVEVCAHPTNGGDGSWRKATIIAKIPFGPVAYVVQGTCGARAVVLAEHIRDHKIGEAMYEHAAKLAVEP